VLDGLHRKVGVSSVNDFPESDLWITCSSILYVSIKDGLYLKPIIFIIDPFPFSLWTAFFYF
jgi:hypothetical protein